MLSDHALEGSSNIQRIWYSWIMAEHIAFYSAMETTRFTPYHHKVAALGDQLEPVEYADDVVIVDGEELPLSVDTKQTLARTLTGVQGGTHDCLTFAAELCGGEVSPDLRMYMASNRAWTLHIAYREVVALEDAEGSPKEMEPTALGKLVKKNGKVTFEDRHTAVRLGSDTDLFAHKLGPGPVCLSSLEAAAELYGCDAIAPIFSMDAWTGWRRQRHQLRYRAADADETSPDPLSMRVSASELSWLARRLGATAHPD
jgi:hypothetical protein